MSSETPRTVKGKQLAKALEAFADAAEETGDFKADNQDQINDIEKALDILRHTLLKQTDEDEKGEIHELELDVMLPEMYLYALDPSAREDLTERDLTRKDY